MPDSSLDLLREAIFQRAVAVLSLPKQGTLCHFKTRFLAEENEEFVVEPVPVEPSLLESAIAHSANIGIAFRVATSKVIFISILGKRTQAAGTGGIWVRYPEQLHILQRRSAYRAVVGDDSQVDVRVWRIPDFAILRDRPPAAQEVHVKLIDLSAGGMGIGLRPDLKSPLAVDQRLRILLNLGDDEAILDGRVRHVREQPDRTLRAGVQFNKLENDVEGRQTLSKLSMIVAHLERQDISRARQKEESQQLDEQKMQINSPPETFPSAPTANSPASR